MTHKPLHLETSMHVFWKKGLLDLFVLLYTDNSIITRVLSSLEDEFFSKLY
jgi:hypothetical protein